VSIKLSAEDRLVNQLESIVSSVIKALEGLEKELSEYIEVTNRRLDILEKKMKKFESLEDVKSKGGLVKAIESSSNSEQVKPLAHLARHQSSNQQSTLPDKMQQQASLQQQSRPSIMPPVTPSSQQQQQPGPPNLSKLPPIPKPPSFETSIETIKAPTVRTPPPIVHETPSELPKKDGKPQLKKKEDNDKEELMSALKTIDAL